MNETDNFHSTLSISGRSTPFKRLDMKKRLKFLLISVVIFGGPFEASLAQEIIDDSRAVEKPSIVLGMFRRAHPDVLNAKIRNLRQPDSHDIYGEYSVDNGEHWKPFALDVFAGGRTF